MADETTTEETTTDETTEESTEEQRVPYERFDQVNKKAKEAAEKAKAAEKRAADLQRQLEEREEAGLPELERIKKAAEQAEKRAAEAEARAEAAEKERERGRRERWVVAAASEQNFVDPDDATRYVDFDAIEDADQAARAVKAVAKKKQHLVKAAEPTLPGKVLNNGQAVADGKPKSNIDQSEEAQMLAEGLKQFASKS